VWRVIFTNGNCKSLPQNYLWPQYILVNRTNLVQKVFLIGLLFFSTCFGQLCALNQEKIPYPCNTWNFSLYVEDCLVCKPESALHTRQLCIYSDKYRTSHRYGIFSWWWAHSWPKYVEKSNKHIKKKHCATSWFYLQEYTRMQVNKT
jgi:hypothetical protein